ncbi:MAG: 50S ribosomal protein L24 [Parcubacteria group bacterium]|mgnify:CR=1 FL=1|jgi:large subunit ribosomal protein L24|nr:50S ribosomal protein L24 [Parcubacteria group bacterium]|tara:strand:- start:1386 stop:1691 length:306 start_codon:yes stop_codon:yes gene_type:complete
MKIHKGDQVLIMKGKDRGKKGKILQAFPKEKRILVENVNLRKKHVRPKKSGEKGQIIEIPLSIDVSNVKLICSKCGKPSKVGYKIGKGKKYRICKKCGQNI